MTWTTWGEFKKEMEEKGIKDVDKIEKIDVSQKRIEPLNVYQDNDKTWICFN